VLTLAYVCVGEQGVPNVVAVRQLGGDEERSVRADKAILNRFWSDNLPTTIVQLNLIDLKETLDDFRERHRVEPRIFESSQRLEYQLQHVNRLLMNFLSSARSFFDHTASRLAHNHPELVAVFDRVRKTAYDESFSYRLMENLRNYAQHAMVPIMAFRGERHQDSPSATAIMTDFSFLIRRADLLKSKKLQSRVRVELQAQPEAFDFLPHAEEYGARLFSINVRLLRRLLPDVAAAAHRLKAVLDEVTPLGFPLLCNIERRADDITFSQIDIPFRSIELAITIDALIVETAWSDED